MPHGITRREFLQYSAAALAAFSLTPLLPNSVGSAKAAPPRQASAPVPAFEPLPLPAQLGAPADVAIGTEGVFWVLGESGAPSTYDPLQQVWQPYGGGIDAVAYVTYRDANDNDVTAVSYFRGSQVFEAGQQDPVAIAERWQGPPGLPPSFQGGVDGAVNLTYGAVLFRLGQAAFLTDSGAVAFVQTLASFGSWPSGAWEGGRFDYVISGRQPGPGLPNYVYFVLGSEYITVDLDARAVFSTPAPLATFYQGAALALLAQAGNQAVLVDGSIQDAAAALSIFGGPAVYKLENATSSSSPQVSYIVQQDAHWPAAWHPVLNQAPAGQIGSLWGLTAAGIPLFNDGSGWNPVPLPNGTSARDVDVGTDSTVFAVDGAALYSLAAGGGSWNTVATTALDLQGLAVGDGSHVWVRDSQGAVYQYNGSSGSFTPANLGVAAMDFKANPDGTLWHCSAGNPHAYRYISEGQLPSEAIALGPGITSVLKVASSGFGTGYFLAKQNGQAVLVRYTSPYLFKTSASYWSYDVDTMAVGAASLFMFTVADPNKYFVAALDAQTGAERWRYPYPATTGSGRFAPAYDPQRQLVYVFVDAGLVSALDAHSGSVVWSLQLESFIAAQPVLAGGMIYIPGTSNPNSNQTIYLTAIDAADAAQRAAAGGTPVTAWATPMSPAGATPTPTRPVYSQGCVYCAAWSASTGVNYSLSIFKLDGRTGSLLWANTQAFELPTNWSPPFVAPVISTVSIYPVVLINIAQGIAAYGVEDGQMVAAYITPNQPAGVTVDSALVLYDNVVYFSDSTGLLYALDTNLNPVAGSPYQVASSSIKSGLRIMPDTEGKAIVVFGDPVTDNLNFYSTATADLAALATNQTMVNLMSEVTRDGLICVGGYSPQDITDSVGQIFAIRVNDVSGLRDFVIESQLLQDYDPGPKAVARYQTHVTIVDDAKTPLPFTSVKIWADAPLAVQVDGVSYTIGPDTPLATEVDASGALTIASVATDLFVTPLRIWAAFMDPFERIVIYPDREFHNRLPGMIADPTNDDPEVINLATGTNYAGIQVFTDQQQAHALATAVATTCQAAGIAGSVTGSTAGSAAGGLSPYIAYGDLPGVQYSPYNTPASRTVLPQNPYGVSWSSDTAATYTVLPFAAAAGSVDALSGAVDPSLDPSLVGPTGSGLGSSFSDLWHKIKSGVAKVAKVIVSVGNTVYTGIQYVENGVTKVFRFVVRQIEELAATVGAFFVALGKAIEDVIELLSLLLHFEEVVKTHKILKAAILQQINGLFLTGTTIIQPAVKGFFANDEAAIEQAFCTVKQQIVPGFTCSVPGAGASPPVNQFNGIGATAHTIFSVAPKAGGSAKSHAVGATWGFDKVRSHYKQATTPGSTATAAPAAAAGNPILDFVNSFANSLTTNATLQQAYTATLNDFAASFAFKSSTEFLQMAVFDLLDVVQDLLISSLAIGEAFFEGLLALAGDLVTFLLDPQQGILVQPLDIPILSDLYQWLFGSALTFLDLIILVAAIPVTFLYRIVEGQWLSEQVPGNAAGEAASAAQATLTPLARALGLLNASFFFGRGILMPINDTSGQPGAPNPITSYSLAAISTGFFATTMLKAASASDLVFVATSLGLIVTPYFLTAAPAVASFLALARIGAFIFAMAAKPSADALLALGGNLLGSLPALAQPLKYLNNATDDISLAVLLALEIIGNFGAAFVDFINTTVNWDAAPTDLPPTEEPVPNWSTRLHLPFVQTGP